MATYFSPDGNPEVWAEKPEGYFTPEEWAAAHPEPEPEPPTEAEIKAARIAEIHAALDDIDRHSVRPLRAIIKGVGTDEDTNRLAALEQKAEDLRAELAGLEVAE